MSHPTPPPVPIAPLAYDSVPRQWRPGIVTAMGVLSIVIACLSGLVSLYSCLMSVGFVLMSQVSAPSVAWPAAPLPAEGPVVTVTVGGISMNGDDIADGLPEQPRRDVMRVLEATVALNAARVRQLDALMKFGGRLIFPSAADGASLENIRANITDSGRMYGAGNTPGPQFFVVGTGKIEVYDDHAVFRPDGSSDVISISAPAANAPSTAPVAVPLPAGVSFTRPVIRINPLAGGASIVASLVSLGLAVYLLVIGIMVLRDSPAGGKLHCVYVAMKVPQVVLAAVSGWWVARGLASSISSVATAAGGPMAAPPPAWASVMAASAVVFSAFALAYPIALVFVLSNRAVRDYYAALRDYGPAFTRR